MGIKNTIVKGFSLLKPIPLKDKIINYASLEVAVKGIFKEIKKKEPKITRTDVPEENSQSVFSGLGAFNLKNWLIDNYTALFNTRLAHGGYGGTAQTLFNLIEAAKNSLTSLINGKENSFGKNNAFNKNFGTLTGTVLEGAKLAETLGLEYGGIVNNNSAKVAGKAYYCTANKAIYKCTQNTSLNYIDANYFEGLSNDKLLGKLQNLFITGSNEYGSYKKYSDGTIECWGTYKDVPTNQFSYRVPIAHTVNFNKPYSCQANSFHTGTSGFRSVDVGQGSDSQHVSIYVYSGDNIQWNSSGYYYIIGFWN